MRKFLPALVIASCALGLGLAAGSLVATANYSPAAIEEDAGHGIDVADFPIPVMGNDLFVGQNPINSCMSRDRVIDQLLADQTDLGGRTVKVADDRYQAFADIWRDHTGMTQVEISGIVGHIFFDESVEEWTVDVVEFDSAGCAMSRTLMSGTLWTALLKNSGEA
jgi:hypothetical protein